MLPTLQRISRSPLASAGPSVPCRSLMGVTDASPGDPPSVVGHPKPQEVHQGQSSRGLWEWVGRLSTFGGSKGLLDIKVWWHQKVWGSPRPQRLGGPPGLMA